MLKFAREVAIGSLLFVVHSVRFVLAHCVAGAGDVSLGVADHPAPPHFRHRGHRSPRSSQCAVSVAGTIAPRPTRHLRPRLSIIANCTVNRADFR